MMEWKAQSETAMEDLFGIHVQVERVKDKRHKDGWRLDPVGWVGGQVRGVKTEVMSTPEEARDRVEELYNGGVPLVW